MLQIPTDIISTGYFYDDCDPIVDRGSNKINNSTLRRIANIMHRFMNDEDLKNFIIG